jgi:hypothetical protein
LPHPTTEEVTLPEPVDTTDHGSFPACQVSFVNPVGSMLVLRADDVPALVDLINGVWDAHLKGHQGDREDVTNLMLFSFNPGLIADMRDGRTAEEAMGYEPDELATAAYKALQAGATRQPVTGAPAANGKGGGGSKPIIFTVEERGADNLPEWFIDALTRNDTCPECKDPDGRFYDNRGPDQGQGPAFRCANRDCKTPKGYPWGIWDPASSSRSRGGSARTR